LFASSQYLEDPLLHFFKKNPWLSKKISYILFQEMKDDHISHLSHAQ